MEDYVQDKRLIYKDQTAGDYSIFDAEEDELGTGPDKSLYPESTTWGNLFASESKATVLRYGKQPLENTSAVVNANGKKIFGVWQETKKD